MKRIALIIVTLFLLTACGNGDTSTPPDDTSTTLGDTRPQATGETIAQYFPIKTNAYYEYVSSPTNAADQQVYISYADGGRIQRRVTSSFVETTEVLDLQNGELRLIYSEPQFYYLENITSVQPIMDMLLLKEPLATGQKWKMDDTAECEITGMDIPVETKYGSFTAMEITTVMNTGIDQKEYYVKGIGLVKTVYNAGGQVTIELANITDNSALDIPILFYYPAETEELGKEARIIKFSTNTDLTGLFEKEFKTPGEGNAIMADSAAINTMSIDRTTDILYLDMNKAFMSDISRDAGYESMALQSIANTLGNFYDVDQILLTIDGKEYQSAHLHMTMQDYLQVEKEVLADEGESVAEEELQ